MTTQNALPIDATGPPPADDMADRFIEELYHCTYLLTECTGSALAVLGQTGVQWLACAEHCPCSQLPHTPPACLDGRPPQGRSWDALPLDSEGKSLGTALICCEANQRPLVEAIRQLAYAALRHVELERENDSLMEELSASWESLEAVYEISADMRLLNDAADVLNRIATKALTIQSGLRAVLWREQGGQLIPTGAKETRGLAARALEDGLIKQAMSRRQAIILNGRARILSAPTLEPELRNAVSLAVVPVATRQGVLGALAVWQEQGDTEFDSRALRLLETLALQAAMVIENERLHRESIESERLRQEVQIGSEIQQMLLLGQPPCDLPDLDIAAFTIPSQRVDGDFYEFIRQHERCLDVIVGDVMGKGIPAALLGAATKSHFLRAIGRLRSASTSGQLAAPVDIVSAVSSAVTRQLIEIESFVTLCYARLDLDARRLTFVDCGHTRTILYRQRRGTCEYLQGKNLPLGVVEDETYQQVETSFEDGDVVLFYSDGVTETHDAAGRAFGETSLAAVMREHGRRSPVDLIEAIRAAVTGFSQSTAFADDFTCVAVKITRPTPVPSPAQTILEVSSDLTELARVRDFVRGLRAPQRLPSQEAEEQVQALVQAVNEAVTNVIEHAYRGQPGRPIRLEAELGEDHTTVRIYDWGEPFDPTTVELPAFDGSRESGFGVYIIAHSVDHIQYNRDASGRNCLSLTKNFSVALDGGG
jgi:sigma-B regulation protein RsbU (phosphoserine phosphatase)